MKVEYNPKKVEIVTKYVKVILNGRDKPNFDGEIIVRGAEQIYSEFYDISDDRLKPYANRYNEFLTNFRDVEFNFVGDKFYEKYLK